MFLPAFPSEQLNRHDVEYQGMTAKFKSKKMAAFQVIQTDLYDCFTGSCLYLDLPCTVNIYHHSSRIIIISLCFIISS
jgi:hypothetical protein